MKIIDKLACPKDYNCRDCKHFIIYGNYGDSLFCKEHHINEAGKLYISFDRAFRNNSPNFCEDYESNR